jgi:predicted phosphodiesterase
MSIIWSEEEAKIVHTLIEQDKLYREISAALSKYGYERTPEAVRKFHKRTQDEMSGSSSEYEIIEPMLDNALDERYHVAIQKIREMRDRLVKVTSDKFVKVGRPVNANVKVLSISDLHIPFENPKVVEFLIEQHGDADVLVLNGDIFEMFVVSKWPKSKVVLLRHEYEIAIEWMKLFVNIFPKVVLVSGNHEHRMQSYFAASIDPAVNFMVSDDILARLKKGYAFEEDGTFAKKYDWENQVFYDGGLLRHYVIIGKTIFIHPNDFSSVPMRTAINWTNDLIDKEDFECMVMAHTHKMGSYIWRNKLLLEQGSCCVPLDYEAGARARKSLQSYGGAVVFMDKDGHVDFDRTKNIYYGTGSAIKVDDALRLLQ